MADPVEETEDSIDQTLVEQVMKYKGFLQTKEYLSIEEREKDRQILNNLYTKLFTVKQKILDSKCYLHLGEMQKELASLLLQDETSHDERVFMLSYILRCVCYPVVHIHNVNQINTSLESSGIVNKNIEEEQVYNEKDSKKFNSKFTTKEISIDEIQQIKLDAKRALKKHDPTNLDSNITWQQAEIISQMAANGEVKLKIPKQIKNAPLSIVIKKK